MSNKIQQYSGTAVLILSDGSEFYMGADLVFGTIVASNQQLDWVGRLSCERTADLRMSLMFGTYLQVGDAKVRCYIQEAHFSSEEIRLEVRDDDSKNPLSKALASTDLLVTLPQ